MTVQGEALEMNSPRAPARPLHYFPGPKNVSFPAHCQLCELLPHN